MVSESLDLNVSFVLLFGSQTSLQLGSKMLRGFGVMSDDVSFLSRVFTDSMEIQAQDEITAAETNAAASQVPPLMKPMRMKASDTADLQLVKPVQVKASDSKVDSAEVLQETDDGLSQPETDNGLVGKAEKAPE